MKIKTILLLAVAVGCGLVAMLGVQQSMSGFGQSEPEERVSVLMAVTDIAVGEPLTAENVTFREVSIDTAPENAVLTEEEYADRSTLVPLMANDFVTTPKLSAPGVRGESVNIPKGMRVVTVPVNETTSHSGMLAAGDRVDVLVTYQSRTPRGQTTQTKVLLEFIEVFATGNNTVSNGSNDTEQRIKNVSLLVTPEQMPYVKLAEKKGSLSLSWRRMDDDEFVQPGMVDEELMAELQGNPDKDARGYGFSRYDSEDRDERPGLKNWLDQREQEAAEVPEPEPVEVVEVAMNDPAKPMWKMEIFRGEEREVVELELPEEETGETGATDLPTDTTNGTSGAADPQAAPGTEPVSAPADAKASPWRSILKGLNFGQGA